MKNALELLNAYLDNVQDAELASSLFAEDGAIELPYLDTLGFPWRAEGPAEVKKFLENILTLFTDFKFLNRKIFIDTADQVFGEYEISTTVASSGKKYDQLYMGRLVAESGKIKLLREALDMAKTTQAFADDKN